MTTNDQVNHERPETHPTYLAVATVLLRSVRESVIIGLKETGLDVHFRDGEVLHFDLEGRLLRIAGPDLHWRRGLSGRTLRIRRRSRREGGGMERRGVPPQQWDELLRASHQRMVTIQQAFDAGDIIDLQYINKNLRDVVDAIID